MHRYLTITVLPFVQMLMDSDSIPLEQKDNGRTAEFKISLFFSRMDAMLRGGQMVVLDFADQKSADLHLNNGSEVMGSDDLIFSAVLRIHGNRAQCDGPDAMQLSAYFPRAADETVHCITISVIMCRR